MSIYIASLSFLDVCGFRYVPVITMLTTRDLGGGAGEPRAGGSDSSIRSVMVRAADSWAYNLVSIPDQICEFFVNYILLNSSNYTRIMNKLES